MTDVCESAEDLSKLAVDENLKFFKSQLVKNHGEHPRGLSRVNRVAIRGPFLLCPSIPLLASLFVIFLGQKHLYEKLTSERLSFSCRSIFEKWNVASLNYGLACCMNDHSMSRSRQPTAPLTQFTNSVLLHFQHLPACAKFKCLLPRFTQLSLH